MIREMRLLISLFAAKLPSLFLFTNDANRQKQKIVKINGIKIINYLTIKIYLRFITRNIIIIQERMYASSDTIKLTLIFSDT